MSHVTNKGYFGWLTKSVECAVGDLRRVEWSRVAFDRLQLPEDKRHILLSVITSRLYSNSEVVFDDFIEGKGRGLNVLL